MKIAACMIALDEEKFIRRVLESLHWVDTIVIVDGGSKDNTMGIVRSMAPSLSYVELPRQWKDDFSRQRQFANDYIAHYADEFDWWFRVDCDEQLPDTWTLLPTILQQLPDQIICARIRQNNLIRDEKTYSARRGGWETHPRIFRNLQLPNGSSAWRWQGQVHEYPNLMDENGLNYPNLSQISQINLAVTHFGWLDNERRQEREDLYLQIEGSNFSPGELVNRKHKPKRLPYEVTE
ncbi:MAG: glycosyltransferase [Candidatus Altiarchaeales archaeon]|nr:glycosyltransferase [Candidatus Altiarchaeales archaeon]